MLKCPIRKLVFFTATVMECYMACMEQKLYLTFLDPIAFVKATLHYTFTKIFSLKQCRNTVRGFIAPVHS